MDTVDNKSIPVKETALDLLKKRADDLGIIYNPRIGEEKLQAKITQFLAEAEVSKTTDTPVETFAAKKARIRREASELIRCRIHCLNPMKKNWAGEVISVGNSHIGTFKKMVPFGLDAGYHVPKIIFNELKSRKFQHFYTVKGVNGKPDQKKSKLMNAFNIEVLPNLTEKELAALAHEQAVNHSIDQD